MWDSPLSTPHREAELSCHGVPERWEFFGVTRLRQCCAAHSRSQALQLLEKRSESGLFTVVVMETRPCLKRGEPWFLSPPLGRNPHKISHQITPNESQPRDYAGILGKISGIPLSGTKTLIDCHKYVQRRERKGEVGEKERKREGA